MKRMTFLFVTLALAAGCSASTSPDPKDDTASTDAEIKKGHGSKLSCASVGGQCTGIHYQACQGGTWADANVVTCGAGIGVGCCVMPQPPPPPPAPNACESFGGRCTGISPSACPEGFFADATQFSCGGGVGVGCCVACPTLSPPAPSFCPNGTIKPRKDEAGCIHGYDCVPAANNACEAAGGSCVGLSPSSCPSGNWADASTHPCGTGIGVGWCLP